ncbi:MAG: hypothetical protein GX605_12670, partial [Chloroflexi bacterium]|nr:hypothetical protein [Chloroflexota bacterium]
MTTTTFAKRSWAALSLLAALSLTLAGCAGPAAPTAAPAGGTPTPKVAVTLFTPTPPP